MDIQKFQGNNFNSYFAGLIYLELFVSLFNNLEKIEIDWLEQKINKKCFPAFVPIEISANR